MGSFEFAIRAASQNKSLEHPAASNRIDALATAVAQPSTGPFPLKGIK